jgi:general secretion pathway protein J
MIKEAHCIGAGRSDAGFTLVELLVALSLLSLLTLALVGSFRFGVQAWGRSAVQSERLDNGIIVQQLLRHLITDVYPLYVSNDPTHRYVDFEGTKTSMKFLSSAPIVLGGGGRAQFRIFPESRAGQNELILIAKRELDNRDGSTASNRKLLLSKFNALEFSYFGKGRADREQAWHDTWIGEPVLPQLVRISVRFPPGGAQVWSDLFVAPAINVDVGCVYETFNKSCRGR